MKRLETERLILRPWCKEDAEDLFAYASTPKVEPMAGWKPHESLDESRKILKMFMEENDTWALELKGTHRVIGSVGLHDSKRAGLSYDREIGYVLSEDYWGRGLIVEAVKEVLAYAFIELQMETLIVAHFDFNHQSKRVIEKLGFARITHLTATWKRYDGERLDEEVYAMTREQYDKKYKYTMCVNEKEYSVMKLLGKGKGGYSYLVSDDKKQYVLKQIHHEPCDYYQFGNKIEAEQRDYRRLREIGIPMPEMLEVDIEKERILKEYIKGDTIYEKVLKNEMEDDYFVQMKDMCRVLYASNTNIDYFPTNFVVQEGKLYYIDYECNDYMEEWNFENWGVKYWSKTEEFLKYVDEHTKG